MILDSSRVPTEVVALLPLAAKWGIGDDWEREQALDSASAEQLARLATCLDEVDSEALFDWLAGPESFDSNPSQEYLALTCLTMAVDSAKLKLRTRSATKPDDVS